MEVRLPAVVWVWGGGTVGKCVKSDAKNEKQSKRVYMR